MPGVLPGQRFLPLKTENLMEGNKIPEKGEGRCPVCKFICNMWSKDSGPA
jgi:hypothetical protein